MAVVDNPYKVLGVSPSEPKEVIRKKYRALASKYHPDNSETGDHSKFIQVQEAWETIDKYHAVTMVVKKDVWRHKSFFTVYKED